MASTMTRRCILKRAAWSACVLLACLVLVVLWLTFTRDDSLHTIVLKARLRVWPTHLTDQEYWAIHGEIEQCEDVDLLRSCADLLWDADLSWNDGADQGSRRVATWEHCISRLGYIGTDEAAKALVSMLEERPVDAGATLLFWHVISEMGAPALPYLKDYNGVNPRVARTIAEAIEAGEILTP